MAESGTGTGADGPAIGAPAGATGATPLPAKAPVSGRKVAAGAGEEADGILSRDMGEKAAVITQRSLKLMRIAHLEQDRHAAVALVTGVHLRQWLGVGKSRDAPDLPRCDIVLEY